MSCTTGGTRSARAGCVSSVRPGHAGGGGDHRHKQGAVRPATEAAGTLQEPAERTRARGKLRAISSARLWRRRLYTCALSTSSSLTALISRSSHLAEGFALRCLQRLSRPDAATRRCAWRHNRQTGGPSDTVLSY